MKIAMEEFNVLSIGDILKKLDRLDDLEGFVETLESELEDKNATIAALKEELQAIKWQLQEYYTYRG